MIAKDCKLNINNKWTLQASFISQDKLPPNYQPPPKQDYTKKLEKGTVFTVTKPEKFKTRENPIARTN